MCPFASCGGALGCLGAGLVGGAAGVCGKASLGASENPSRQGVLCLQERAVGVGCVTTTNQSSMIDTYIHI